MAKTQPVKRRALIIKRTFDAPREYMWKAWTEPELAARWWGPKGYTTPVCKIELRVGGKYINDMRSPDGKDYWSTGVYREIAAPERLVMTDNFADEKGNVVPASHYGMDGDWSAATIAVTFEEVNGKTRQTLEHRGIVGISDEDFEGMRQGWSESLDKLAQYLDTVKKRDSMPKLGSIMIGSRQPKVLAEFYEKVLGKPDMTDGWFGWKAGSTYFSIGEHSEVKGKAKEPQRVILNFETEKVKEEFARIKNLGAKAIKEPYEMEGAWIATFADPEGNYFQLMSPWEM
jgi:uncharacterized protein YndB with AHSA1/START domain/predicted enzyme related to lactoylglutathione lyase